MSTPRHFYAQPYVEAVKSPKATATDSVLTALVALQAPFVTPADVAAHLGLTPNAVRYHCRNCSKLKNWAGSYRFFMDDAGHVLALQALVSLAVHSMKSLPSAAQPKVH